MTSLLRKVLAMGPLLIALSGMAQPAMYAIWKDDEVVGHVQVDRVMDGARTRYAMTSRSEVVVLWTQEVITSMGAEFENGRLLACHTTTRVNDSVRDSSSLCLRTGAPKGYLHPGRSVHQGCSNAWTTARMYYEEPIGQRAIFVESVLRDCPIECVGPGTYRLILPDRNVNQYVYRNGVLQEIQVDRTFFDLVFKRL